MKTSKRKVATLVPYYLDDGVPHFFLQKRTADAPTYAGCFGFFGGHIEEGETAATALVREIQEELLFTPIGHAFLAHYERPHSINHMFFLLVDKHFASMVTVCEGEYGAFLTLAEVAVHHHNGIVLPDDFFALQELSKHLS